MADHDLKDPAAWGRGVWMQTFTGGQFFPQDPRPEDFCIEDIAHALAIENRYGGHLPQPYSVAQHSVLVVNILIDHFHENDPSVLRWGLLHDASEAYIKDIPRPLKRALGESYLKIERSVMAAICARFNLDTDMPVIVKRADEVALATEKRDLFPASNDRWTLSEEPFDHKVVPYRWEVSKALFQDAWSTLKG